MKAVGRGLRESFFEHIDVHFFGDTIIETLLKMLTTEQAVTLANGVMDALDAAELKVIRDYIIPTGRAARIDLDASANVNLYDNGTVLVQGRDREYVRWVLRDFVNNPPD
ncbi:MAG: hypothetical protein Q7J29_02630 [Stagnimonas sp.]|nr:hypothetical protein [Stagnimonas sp.]